ncbi:MAG: hypothetical protein ACKVQC_09165 [Elusimicrobiota bacterium]
MKKLTLIALLTFFLSPLSYGQDFWSYWGDGKAELSGYTITQPRYGQNRTGKAVMIFVTEDHSLKERVKIEGDSTNIPANQRYSVLKLNFLKTFQTGIYDYKVMSSVFSQIDKNMEPSRISLSVQEWCGHVFDQVVSDGKKVTQSLHSYFGGEADQNNQFTIPNNLIYEDSLPILMRELNSEWLKKGETKEAVSVPMLLSLRFTHKPFEFGKVRVTKSAESEIITTALGKKETTKWLIDSTHFGQYTYWIEKQWPKRILRWKSSQGESGEITGTTRLPYWSLNANGDEKNLSLLFPREIQKK